MVPGEGRATFKALDRTDTYRQTSALNRDTPRGFVPGVLAGFPEPSLVQNPASQPQEQQRVQSTPRRRIVIHWEGNRPRRGCPQHRTWMPFHEACHAVVANRAGGFAETSDHTADMNAAETSGNA